MDIDAQIIDIEAKDIDGYYEVLLFCRNLTGESVCVRVQNYQPYFYVNCQNEEEVAKKCFSPVAIQPVSKHIFDTYCENPQKFLKIFFNSSRAFYKSKENIGTLWRIFNVDVKPYLAFCHDTKIQPSGWIIVNEADCVVCSKISSISTCTLEIQVDWQKIQPKQSTDIAPIVVAAFDIETTSQDVNRFPVFTIPDDKIIQIGITVSVFGLEGGAIQKHIVVLGKCNQIKGAYVHCCASEKDIIIKWAQLMKQIDPDIITGYNIFGYDYEYIFERAMFHKVVYAFSCMQRIARLPKKQEELRQLNQYDFSSQVEDSKHKYLLSLVYFSRTESFLDQFKIIKASGRIHLDLLRYCRQNGDKLNNYKLNTVALHNGLCKGKIHMPYQRIFQIYHCGSVEEKTEVAEYCLQDCLLCNQLIDKLNVVPNYVGMSSTCYVPINYLCSRGQGIKVLSLLMSECTDLNFIIPHIRHSERNSSNRMESGYIGGFVLDPEAGFHPYPVNVLDFASLYPSCMISHNLCISSKLTDEQCANMCEEEYKTVEWTSEFPSQLILDELQSGAKRCKNLLDKYPRINQCFQMPVKFSFHSYSSLELNPSLSYRVEKLCFLMLKSTQADAFFNDFGIDQNRIFYDSTRNILQYIHRHYFIKAKTFTGVLPSILRRLLNKRNETKKLMSKYAKTDPFLASIYNGLQLSYKITANSVYGQMGASFSVIGNIDVASSITATARNLLMFAKDEILTNFVNSRCIYGDTDSVFMAFETKQHLPGCPNLTHKRYVECLCPLYKPESKEALNESIKMAERADKWVTDLLPCSKTNTVDGVHQLEYEKTFHPFLSFAKKKYTGLNVKRQLKSKGIVIVRRDNCELLRHIYRKCVDLILQYQIDEAVQFLENMLIRIYEKKEPMHRFVITKALRDFASYKSEKQAHLILARRVQKRDPGSAYQPGDRVEYCYVVSKKKSSKTKELASELVETPEFIKENNLMINYEYYIRNQFRNPLIQLFELVGKKREVTFLIKQYSDRIKAKLNKNQTIQNFFKPAKQQKSQPFIRKPRI